MRSSSDRIVPLDNQFQQDIAWFNCFVEKFNGVFMIHKHALPQIHVHVDASLTGIGAVWDEHVYAATYPPCYLVDKSIVHLQHVGSSSNVGFFWHGKPVKIYCDNGPWCAFFPLVIHGTTFWELSHVLFGHLLPVETSNCNICILQG